ncbi:hypothetical protein F5887DRAFT_897438 [Amanita rubescens]|nr:hypothetical protein F5887DRAFT_897438 [Amanita rubescens]
MPIFFQFPIWIMLVSVMLCYVPAVAAKGEQPFPDITFKMFNKFVENHFSSTVTLSVVLMTFFTTIENVDLLSLHFRQRNAEGQRERSTVATGWIRCLGHALNGRLRETSSHLLKASDVHTGITDEKVAIVLGLKIDALAKLLDLYPCKTNGKFKGNLKPVSQEAIQPVHIVCPGTAVCQTYACNKNALYQWSRQRDIPLVRLMKNFISYENVPVLSGYCKECKTLYYADHERAPIANGDRHERVYLNAAKHVKIGSNLWVDRKFTSAVLSGIYTFHASADAFSDFCNDGLSHLGKVTRRQIWQAFVQESIRFIASNLNINLTLQDGLSIDEVTRQAFNTLGEDGIIRAAEQHTCEECTHKYKESADVILSNNISGMVGMDEVIQGETNVENEPGSASTDTEYAPVTMVVIDGIVMGHSHCAYNDCTSDLQNSRGGMYCAFHENLYGGLCHVANCSNPKVQGTEACGQHQGTWQRYLRNHRQQALGGFRRALRRPDETWPWMPQSNNNVVQPHDEEQRTQRARNSFTPPRFYCVETICAPCGVVVAWAKFAKSESPANIMSFLEKVYPTSDSRPDYVCIDKACLVLRSCLVNGRWEEWKNTTRFIVDTYHYSNHRATDQLCREWCNPAPMNGSAPNLVIAGRTAEGELYYKRAFNTQACEQLNAWLGGYEQILKRMTSGNFNWFLHTMLFYHTRHVINNQLKQEKSGPQVDGDDDGGVGIDVDDSFE